MIALDLLLAVLVLVVGIALAWGSAPWARYILFGLALLVSALLFLPGEQLTTLIGPDGLRRLNALAGRTRWTLSDWTHVLIFIWLGLMLWLGRSDLRGWKGLGVMGGLAVAAELAQVWARGRSPRLSDVVLNLSGALVGVALAVMLLILLGKRSNAS